MSLPTLSHGLVQGNREAELTIYLPFIFGRGWFGNKTKNQALLHDEISYFSLAVTCERMALPATNLYVIEVCCARAPQGIGVAGTNKGDVINIG